MAYKVYLTFELPEEYATKELAMDAAVDALRTAVEIEGEKIVRPMSAMEASVYVEGSFLHLPRKHEFVVDICDGCI